jgi:hypothetical protein
VCRGALLAGCRTVWILSGSDAGARRSRALTIQAQDAKEEQKAIAEFAKVFVDDDDVAQAVRESAEAVDVTPSDAVKQASVRGGCSKETSSPRRRTTSPRPPAGNRCRVR